MTQSNRKQLEEQATFRRFAERLGQGTDWIEVASRPEPEPDLLCRHATRGAVTFELVSLTDPELARVLAAGPRARTDAFSTADPSERIVRAKLKRHYETSASEIDLLIYTDGRLITPDDVVIPTIRPWLDAAPNPFRRVWFMGENECWMLWEDYARDGN